jgi:hypothetical protein
MLIRHHSTWGLSRDIARMGVTKDGKYIHYFPSVEAANIIDSWQDGATLDWEVNDEDRRPHAIRLTPASRMTPTSRRNGIHVRNNHYRPTVHLPTSSVGVARYHRPVDVEETISANEIVVSIPFEFAS